ncbi:hypothetical protein jhhlp_002482 [Lomentospora prolificans]|uniref:Small acidic protein n=1 Tax=Lomentospora prolificans TaxID=41688 RepID=A0A2N3NE56_9PEZI|nr:hypothetical protein jhhlp_002482 [Lomentospora prolificans]
MASAGVSDSLSPESTKLLAKADKVAKKELKKLKKKEKKTKADSLLAVEHADQSTETLAQAERLEAQAAKLLKEAAALRSKIGDKISQSVDRAEDLSDEESSGVVMTPSTGSEASNPLDIVQNTSAVDDTIAAELQDTAKALKKDAKKGSFALSPDPMEVDEELSEKTKVKDKKKKKKEKKNKKGQEVDLNGNEDDAPDSAAAGMAMDVDDDAPAAEGKKAKKDKKKKKNKQVEGEASIKEATIGSLQDSEAETTFVTPKKIKEDKKAKKKEKKRKHGRSPAEDSGSDTDEDNVHEKQKNKTKNKKDKKAKKEKAPAESSNERAPSARTEPAAPANWNVGALEGGSERQKKFMRLLGGGKGAAPGAGQGQTASPVSGFDIKRVQNDLQRQYDTGLQMKFDGQSARRGLGA